MTPLERAARAVRDEIAHPHGNGEWILDEGFRDDSYFADVARAVLTAIREPSEGMNVAGFMTMAPGDPEREDAADCWRVMIDAALAEGV